MPHMSSEKDSFRLNSGNFCSITSNSIVIIFPATAFVSCSLYSRNAKLLMSLTTLLADVVVEWVHSLTRKDRESH